MIGSAQYLTDGLILESLGHFDEAEYQRQLNADGADASPIALM